MCTSWRIEIAQHGIEVWWVSHARVSDAVDADDDGDVAVDVALVAFGDEQVDLRVDDVHVVWIVGSENVWNWNNNYFIILFVH